MDAAAPEPLGAVPGQLPADGGGGEEEEEEEAQPEDDGAGEGEKAGAAAAPGSRPSRGVRPKVLGRLAGGARPYSKLQELSPASEMCAAADEGSLVAHSHAAPRGSPVARCLQVVKDLDGMLAVGGSQILFSLMAAFVSGQGEYFPATQQMFARSVVQAAVSLPYLLVRRIPLLGSPGVRRWVLLRGICGALGNWVLYYSVTQIPIGDANTIIFLSPVFTAVFACVLLGEPFLCAEAVALVLSIVGVTLVSQPPFLFGEEAAGTGKSHTVYAQGVQRQITVCVCLFGALLNGTIFIIVKHIGKGAHWMSFVFSFAVCGIFLSGFALAAGLQTPRWPAVSEVGQTPYIMLGVVGALATTAQSFFNFGMQREKPAVASITCQLGVPLSYFWQVVLFREPAGLITMIGSSMVVLSTTTVLGRKLLCPAGSASAPATLPAPQRKAAKVAADAAHGEQERIFAGGGTKSGEAAGADGASV